MKIANMSLIAFLLFAIIPRAADSLPEFAIRSGDLQRAALVASPGKHQTFEITLTREKGAELTAFTKSNLKKQILVSLNGQPIASPVIMESITGEMLRFPAGNDLQKYYDILDQISCFKQRSALQGDFSKNFTGYRH